MKNAFLLLCLSCLISTIFAQQPPASSASSRLEGFTLRQNLKNGSILKNITFESVGPTVFGGRVTDIDVHPTDPTRFYVAYASGGLWKTESNGSAFEPIFDQEAVMTIGDIAIDWTNDVIWIGTGEVNSSRSSYAGLGMYRSTDGGKTWEHRGLPESHHIGRIILHPTDPNTLWVAVLGHLYSPNAERGVYKTSDGGKNWEKVLYVNPNAGAIDLIIDPDNPQQLYAATWERTRRAWNFVESGEGSGIWKSTDGGNNWQRLNTSNSGFPQGEGVGRIGLALTKQDGKPVLYAVLDNYFRRPKEDDETESDALTKDKLRTMSKADFLKLEDKAVEKYLRSNNFPKKYTGKSVMEMVETDKVQPLALVEYLEDANSLLFDTPVIGAEVYRSDDGGKRWRKTHDDFLDQVYNSYGYYFGQITVSPHNANKIYIAGVPVLRSEDGGKTFKNINGASVHVDHHVLWASPGRDQHLIIGNDGGLNISYDDGESWFKCNTPAVGQFYSVAVDGRQPYRIYGGLQDNGVWAGPSTYEASVRWHQTGNYPYKFLMGGDGMQVAIDNRDDNTVYTGYQFGNYFRINQATGDRSYITPKPDLGERPYRWNWQSPIHLSAHNQDIVYFGANKLLRSFNQGEQFDEISDDLTTGGIKGDVAYSTLTTIHESPLRFGLLYVGSDDGLVHLSRDGGNQWENISAGLPERMWVTRVQASAHVEGRVFVSLNGYRWDDFNAYVYKSDDYGKTWQNIGSSLPAEPVNVIKEDPKNPDLLYIGTDHALYISLDGGQTYTSASGGLPAVAVHDLVVHPEENELVLGTHGRSFWKAGVGELQQLDETIMAKALHAFAISKQRYSSRWGRIPNPYTEARVPETKLPVYSRFGGKLTVSILTESELEIQKLEYDLDAGLNYLDYDLSIMPRLKEEYKNALNEKAEEPVDLKTADNKQVYLRPGKYKVVYQLGQDQEEKTLVIKGR